MKEYNGRIINIGRKYAWAILIIDGRDFEAKILLSRFRPRSISRLREGSIIRLIVSKSSVVVRVCYTGYWTKQEIENARRRAKRLLRRFKTYGLEP